jgi:hypothetical protein
MKLGRSIISIFRQNEHYPLHMVKDYRLAKFTPHKFLALWQGLPYDFKKFSHTRKQITKMYDKSFILVPSLPRSTVLTIIT